MLLSATTLDAQILGSAGHALIRQHQVADRRRTPDAAPTATRRTPEQSRPVEPEADTQTYTLYTSDTEKNKGKQPTLDQTATNV